MKRSVVSLVLSVLISFQSNAFADNDIYALNDNETHIAKMLMQHSLSAYLDNETRIPAEDQYYKLTTEELVSAFQRDSIAAFNRFLGAKILVSGKAEKVSISANGQFSVKLTSPSSDISLQALMAHNEPAPKAKDWNNVSLYCSSGGVLTNKILLIDCYTRDRIEAQVNEVHLKQIREFVQGKPQSNTMIPKVVLMSILAIENLPKTSACFDLSRNDYRSCASDVNNIDKEMLAPKLDKLAKDLKARGLNI